jgi:lipoprotein NlpD
MKKSTLLSLLFSLTSIGLMAGCTTPRRPAPVVDMATQSGSTRPSGEVSAGTRVADERGYHTVRKGETLLRIAQDFNQNYHDLVTWNNLSNPNDIRVDQVLRVLPPNGSAQTGSVGAGSGVDVRPLNNATGSTATAPSPPSVSASTTKTGPRGDKRPYSETALAELQKGESANTGAATAPAASATAHTDSPKTGDRPNEAAAASEETPVFIWPAEGKIVSSFESGKKGIDIAGKSGQAVVAAAAGKVMYAGSGIRGYGNLVIVKHSNNLLSAYAHNKSIVVKEGQNVTKGEKIAEMGNSDSDAVKLHFEIRQQGKPVDPAKYLPAK